MERFCNTFAQYFFNAFAWDFCSTSGHFLSASGLLLPSTLVIGLLGTFEVLLGLLWSAFLILLPGSFVILSPTNFVILLAGTFRALLEHFCCTFGVLLE